MSPSILGSTVGRVLRTIIAFGIFTIDVLRIGEDQMATNGTLFKGEVPMTHLVFGLSFEKREEATGNVDLSTVGGGRGYRRWTGAGGFGCANGLLLYKKRGFLVIIRCQNRTFNFKIDKRMPFGFFTGSAALNGITECQDTTAMALQPPHTQIRARRPT